MKKLMLFTAFLMFLFISNCNAQFMIKAGLNLPYFHGGDPVIKGYKHNAPGVLFGGVYRVELDKAIHLQVEALYNTAGAKNPKENDRKFRPHYITLPVMLQVGSGPLTVDVGFYVAYLLWAENHDFAGANFSWNTLNQKWYYYNNLDRGLMFGAQYDAYSVKFGAHMRYGLVGVRHNDKRYGYYNDPTLVNSKTTGFDFSMYVPLKTFKHDK